MESCLSLYRRRPLRPFAWLPLIAVIGLAGCETVPERLPPGQGAVATVPPAAVVPPAAELPPSESATPPAAGDLGPDMVKVALLLPLSGPSGSVGRSLLDAAQLALFDAGDDRLLLLPKDTGGTPAGAAAAAEAALADGAELVLGPLLSGSVAAVAPILRSRGINAVSFSTDRTVAGDGVYLMGFTPGQQVRQVVSFARSRGLARFALLAPENAYGSAVTAALQDAIAQYGGEVVKAATYPPDAGDLTQVVRRFASYDQRRQALQEQRRLLAERQDELSQQALRRLDGRDTLGDAGFDALLLPEGGQRLKTIAPLLAYFDVELPATRLLGTGQWDEPGLGAEPSLVGGWYPASPPDLAQSFRDRFEKAYGRRPPRIASLGYDAVALAAVLAKDPQPTRFGREAIANPNGFSGFDGIFRFTEQGPAERGLAILEVQPRGTAVVSPAPETFQSIGQ